MYMQMVHTHTYECRGRQPGQKSEQSMSQYICAVIIKSDWAFSSSWQRRAALPRSAYTDFSEFLPRKASRRRPRCTCNKFSKVRALCVRLIYIYKVTMQSTFENLSPTQRAENGTWPLLFTFFFNLFLCYLAEKCSSRQRRESGTWPLLFIFQIFFLLSF